MADEETQTDPLWVTVSSVVRREVGETLKEIAIVKNTTPSKIIANLVNEITSYYNNGSRASYGVFPVGEYDLDANNPAVQEILQNAFSGCFNHSGFLNHI